MDAMPVAARSKEDVALDLLKFVAATAHVGLKQGGAAGFGVQPAAKTEDQVQQLLDLYTRCRETVETPVGTAAKG